MAEGQGAAELEGLGRGGDDEAAAEHGADAVDDLGRELGEIGEVDAADALALTPGLAEGDGWGLLRFRMTLTWKNMKPGPLTWKCVKLSLRPSRWTFHGTTMPASVLPAKRQTSWIQQLRGLAMARRGMKLGLMRRAKLPERRISSALHQWVFCDTIRPRDGSTANGIARRSSTGSRGDCAPNAQSNSFGITRGSKGRMSLDDANSSGIGRESRRSASSCTHCARMPSRPRSPQN